MIDMLYMYGDNLMGNYQIYRNTATFVLARSSINIKISNKNNYQKWCFVFILKVFYVHLSKIYTETAEISKKKNSELCAWASHFIRNYKITVLKEISFPECLTCKYCVPVNM